MKKCVFAGTFDPPTVGHLDTITDAAKIFDEVVVAVMINPQKTPLFNEEERKEMLRLLCKDVQNVKIVSFAGAAIDLLKAENTPFYVRGIRNVVDLEYENADCYASRKLDGEMVTVYIPAKQEHLHVTSTLVRNSIIFEKPYEEYVGAAVAAYMRKNLEARKKNDV